MTQISTTQTPNSLSPAPPYGRQGRRRVRGPGRPLAATAAARTPPTGPRLPARRRLRRPAARRRPAVDPRHALPRGGARLRQAAPSRVSWEVAEDKAFSRSSPRAPPGDGRPPTTPSRPTSAACSRPPTTGSASRPAARDSPVGAHPHRARRRRRRPPASVSAWSPAPTGRPATSPPTATSRPAATSTPWLHLGDYIYEYGTGEYRTRDDVVRPHAPAARDPHARRLPHPARPYKTDPDLQALHAAAPVDRDLGRPRVRQRRLVGRRREPHRRARRAPGPPAGPPPSRPTSSGCRCARPPGHDLPPAALRQAGRSALLDLRSFRSQQVEFGNGEVDDPDRTITGRAQLDWLKAGLTRRHHAGGWSAPR